MSLTITRRSLLLAGTAAAATLRPRAARASTQGGDAGVLALLLAIEHAQIALYEHAAGLPFHGRVAELAARFGEQERAHADRLGKLGARGSESARTRPYERPAGRPSHGGVAELAARFGEQERAHADRLGKLGARGSESAPPVLTFTTEAKFLRLAQRLEGLAVGAYNGAIPLLADGGLRQATAAIVQVEARHSAAVRILRRSDPAPRAFDRAFEPARAERALATMP